MDEAGRLGVQQAAQNHPGHQGSFFDGTVPEWVGVNVKGVRTERPRRFGDVWLALELLKKLHHRALDKLLLQKERLQKHLKERFGELFQISYDIILYDVTSTYFEGEAVSNPQARRATHATTVQIVNKSSSRWLSPKKASRWARSV